MSSEDVEDESCGESGEHHLGEEGEIVQARTKTNGDPGDGGKGAKKREVPEKGTGENKETKIGVDDRKDKDTHASDFAETGPNGQELTKSDPDVPVGFVDPRTKPQSSYFLKVGIFLALAAACIAAAIFNGPPENVMKSNFDLVKVYGNYIENLQKSFTNQTDRFWKILRSRGLAHLRSKDPSQPLVFLLAAPPAAHEWVDCLATKLAEKLDPQHTTTLARINGKEEKENPPEETKKMMDNLLKEKFAAGHRVAIIHHLELLPPPSPILFYSYCDDQNAPHKHVAVIFTVHMPAEPSPSLSPKEAEGSVEKYLSGEVWVNDDRDAVAALLSRIADTVVLMNGEFSGSATYLCA